MHPILENILFLMEVKSMAGNNGRLKSCGSLWKGKCKTGTMLSGRISMGILGDINIMIFPNQNRKQATDPDYFISVKEDAKDESIPMPTNDDL